MRFFCGNIATMKIEFKLLRAKKETAEGFPLVVELSHQGKRKQKTICFCKDTHFSESSKMVSSRHPDFDILAPVMMDIKIKAKKIKLANVVDLDVVLSMLFVIDVSDVDFLEAAQQLVGEMESLASQFGKRGQLTDRNKLLGNIKVYQNVLKQSAPFLKNYTVTQLDYAVLMRFRNYQTGIGNSKSTVHQYLRTLRTIYNKIVLKHQLHDKKPFTGVFANLKVKSYQSKKKSISREALQVLEGVQLPGAKQQYVNLFLLQFYFGGCDLIDLYFMKRLQIRKNRVYFERGKTNTGLMIDLAIHPKASKLLAYFENTTEWVFPGKKEKTSYETYRGRYAKTLIEVQRLYNIEVLPLGGNLGGKVARHTFANLGKQLGIDADLLRELMGHERDDVDNFYKDKYQEAVRDEALFKIIG